MENNTSLQQQLLEAGVHFGHLRKKWNPKMLPYIFAEKKGIHIIDLNKTTESLQEVAGVLPPSPNASDGASRSGFNLFQRTHNGHSSTLRLRAFALRRDSLRSPLA